MANRADTFNRANNAGPLGTPSDAGSDWVQPSGSGSFLISSNQASQGSPAVNVAYLEASSATGEVQVTCNGTLTDHGPVGRLTDSSNYWYGSMRAGGCYLQKKVAGSYTSFGPYTGASAGAVAKLVFSGSNVSLYLNGVLLTTQSDSFNSTATKHGIGTGNAAGLFDDFSFTDAGGGGATVGNPNAVLLLGGTAGPF